MFKPASVTRVSGKTGELRFENIIEAVEAGRQYQGYCLLGYKTDQGAIRNNGRPGSKGGPDQIRKELNRLYYHLPEAIVYDGGDIIDEGEELEVLQEELRQRILTLEGQGLKVILLGGDHSLAWPQYQAISQLTEAEDLSIINFDAHFDMRANAICNSGTSFHQILKDRQAKGLPFEYRVLGVSPYTNSAKLFQLARQEKVWMQYFDDFNLPEIRRITDESQEIMLNICMDVVGSATAPGVSAVDPLGLSGLQVYQGLKIIAGSGKVRGFALAETAPEQEDGDLTARLAARYVVAYLNACEGMARL